MFFNIDHEYVYATNKLHHKAAQIRSMRNTAVLTLFFCVAGALLSFVYVKTEPIIKHNLEMKEREILSKIFPEADEFKKVDSEYIPYSKGVMLGSIVSTSVRGYSGRIHMLIGYRGDGRIAGLQIVSHSETPGLGSKITREDFLRQFSGKLIDEIKLKRDGGTIDAITGATVSSKAVIEGVRLAYIGRR